MKLNLDSVTKIGSILSTGTSPIIPAVALWLYTELPVKERQDFMVLVIALSILGMIGQVVTATINKISVSKTEQK